MPHFFGQIRHQSRRLGLIRGLGFADGQTSGDKERIKILAQCPINIGQNPISDAEDTTVGNVFAQSLEPSARQIIDGGMWFAKVEAFAAHLCIEFRKSARAPFACLASVHDNIRVGTEQF